VPGSTTQLPWLLGGLIGLAIGLLVALALWLRRRNAEADAPVAPNTDGESRVLSVLRSAVIIVDDTGEVLRASPPAFSLGLVRNDELAHAALLDLVAQVQQDGAIREAELDLPRGLSGTGRVFLQVRVAALGNGEYLVLADDHTAARRIETIRRDFVVNVSHELKTPVGAISLLAETISDAADDPEAVRRFSAQMVTEAQRLSVLVQEIIELSRLQATEALADAQIVNVADVINEAVDRAKTAATAKNIDITTSVEEDIQVYGDDQLLVTAVRNLLDNAVNYSANNTRVGVGASEVDGVVEIDVVDQGIGIPEEEQDRVFERFYRTDPARSRVTGGTGLGLSIVKHVVADHGGEVRVWSQPGAGSTFTLRLPAADEAGVAR